jgi:hypothetical protein
MLSDNVGAPNMGQVFKFICRPLDVIDPAMLTVLGKAYDTALASLRYRGQPPIVRETMALRIFELASQGERDPERLCHAALAALGSRL